MATSDVDWAANASVFLHCIAACHESVGQHLHILKIRLVCKAWCSATGAAIQHWSPHYSCTDAKVIAVARAFPSLSLINLSSCTSRAVNLAPILQLTALKTLKLGNYAIRVPSDSSLALQGLTQLRDLDFCPIGEVVTLELTGLQHLTALHIRGPEVFTVPGSCTDCYENHTAARSVIEQAAVLPSLYHLELSRMSMSAGAIEALSGLTRMKELKLTEVIHTEYLSGTRPKSASSSAALESICQLTGLTDLSLRESFVYMKCISSMSRLALLTSLDLQGVRSIDSLDGLQHLPALRNLNVSDLFSIHTLEPLRSLTGLQELAFARCLMVQSWGGVEALSSLTDLHTLDMQCCAFNSRWIHLLTGLSSLQYLDMSIGNWRDQDVVHLTACTSLQFLGLRDCPSTTASMHQILQERLPELQTIEVECSTSGDQYAGFLGWPY